MARNAEKAQAMLNRFVTAKREEFAKPQERRPFFANEVTDLGQADRWRQQVIREISKEVSGIQDGSLGEHKIRDLNDHINKLLREKRHWERQIKLLGGPDYLNNAPRLADSDGSVAIGTDGYYYFGAARELPGVRELFEKKNAVAQKSNRFELYKKIDADYYGYRDEDDGLLLKVEQEAQTKAIAEAVTEWEQKKNQDPELATESSDGRVVSYTMDEDVEMRDDSGALFRSHVPLPSTEDIEKMVLERRKKALLDKYGGGT